MAAFTLVLQNHSWWPRVQGLVRPRVQGLLMPTGTKG